MKDKGGLKEKQVEVHGSPTRCPYCHESVETSETFRVCRACLGRHHAPCWDELGRCGTCSATEALEEAPQEVDVDLCRSCGKRDPATAYTCPACEQGTCASCYHPRFRRCLGCAGELLKTTRRLEQLKGTLDNSNVWSMILGVGLVCALIGSVATVAEGEVIGALILGAILTPILAIGFGYHMYRSRKLTPQVEELELQLAPFPEPSLTGRLKAGASRLFAKLFG